ncbi:MAG: hypothetical protein AAGD32_04295 [Planctomycetota bacterium]
MPETSTANAAIPEFARDHGTKGKVLSVDGDTLVFAPSGTTYKFHLDAAGFDGATAKLLKGAVQVKARKMYSVPSGGNFIAPIVGEPRTVQGRVIAGDDRTLVLHAGCTVIVELPRTADAIDLNSGQIETGMIVNVVCVPGAKFVAY